MSDRSWIKVVLSVLAFILVIVLLSFGLSGAGSNMDAQMTEAIRRSVSEGAVLCYSVEGAYPESISYLTEKYGVKYDQSRYIVHYRYFAANIRPDVVVVEKGDNY